MTEAARPDSASRAEPDAQDRGASQRASLASTVRSNWLIHGLLYVATWGTTYWHGGFAFAMTIMAILTAHELGHFVAARWHRVPVSLPYFIPLPPQVSLGTLGAVISMPDAITNRNKLFDVGAAGPLAGLLVAVPLLVVGLLHSTVGPIAPDAMIEGNSLAYAAIKFGIWGEWLPTAQRDVALHPMAFAAWVGLLVTMINLIPIGQLDGGHVARAVLGNAHERWSARLHQLMPVIAGGCAIYLIATARARGVAWAATLPYAARGMMPWLVWAGLLWWMRGRADGYHPPVDEAPLTPWRRRTAMLLLVIFLLIFTPIPFRAVL